MSAKNAKAVKRQWKRETNVHMSLKAWARLQVSEDSEQAGMCRAWLASKGTK